MLPTRVVVAVFVVLTYIWLANCTALGVLLVKEKYWSRPATPAEDTLVVAIERTAFGVVVPIPTLPLSAVVVIESFPSTTVFEPKPLALYPITIEFWSLLVRALVSVPRKTE